MSDSFHIGDKVVYPNHGVGVIEQISSRTIGSQVQKLLCIKIISSQLKIEVPCKNVDMVGLRRVVRTPEINEIMDFLTDGQCDNHQDWKYRYKENSDKMRTGSLLEVAMVMKSLLVLHREKPLSFREKKMLERCKYLLVSEMALAKGSEELDVEDVIVKTLAKCKLKFPEVTEDA
jgi:CarD family transcriptional regulator